MRVRFIARRVFAAGMLLGLLSLFVVNSVLACSVDPKAHHCCRRTAGEHPCEVPKSVTVQPLLVAVALDYQDFAPVLAPMAFEGLPGVPMVAEAAASPEAIDFDTGPPGPLLFVLRI